MAHLRQLVDSLMAGRVAMRATAHAREYVYAAGRIFGYDLYLLGAPEDTHEYYVNLSLLLSAVGDSDPHSLEPETAQQWELLARCDEKEMAVNQQMLLYL